MNSPLIGSTPDRVRKVVKNVESSSSLAIGVPCVLTLDGDGDGLEVVLPATAGAAKSTAFLMGVAAETITAGSFGNVLCHGIVNRAVLITRTRAASTDAYAAATLSAGLVLQVNTVSNCFASSGGTQAASGFAPFAVLAESTSFTSVASTTADTSTASTGYQKIFVRLM